MATSTPTYAESDVEFAPASSFPLTYGNDEVEFAEPSSKSNPPSYSTSDVEFAPPAPGSQSAPSLTGEQAATRKLADAEFNRIARGPIDLNAPLDNAQPLPAPSLGPAPVQSVDDREANRLLPNQAQYVTHAAVPQPKTLGDLITNDKSGFTTDVVPGAPVHLEQPETPRQAADATAMPDTDAVPDISPEYTRQGFSTNASGNVVDAGGEPIGKPIEDFGPTMKAAALQLRDGLAQLAPALAGMSDAPGASPELAASAFSTDDGKEGLTKVLNSSMQLSVPLLAIELTRNPAAAQMLMTGIYGGMITGSAARKISQALGGSQSTQDLSETVGGLVGGTLFGGAAEKYAGAGAEKPPLVAPPKDPIEAAPLPQSSNDAGQDVATHPAGKVTGIDVHTGLPLVDRTQPSEVQLAVHGENLPPQMGEAGRMSPEAEAASAQAATATATNATGEDNSGDGTAAKKLARVVATAPRTGDPAEGRYIADAVADGPGLVEQYIKDNTKNGVLNVARDAAAELFPEYVKDRAGQTTAVSTAAGMISNAAFRTALSEPPVAGKEDVRVLTASPGSGKTSGLSIPGEERVGLDVETIMDDYEGARSKMQAIFDSGRTPVIQWVFVDDPAKTVNRMIYRAAGRDGKPGIGRTVPVDYMAHAYDEVPNTLERLKQEFGDRLKIGVIDNSGPKGSAEWYPEGEGKLNHFISAARQWQGRTRCGRTRTGSSGNSNRRPLRRSRPTPRFSTTRTRRQARLRIGWSCARQRAPGTTWTRSPPAQASARSE
jgi:hypothetical protein